MSADEFQPKQKRSEATQQKLIAAVLLLLEHRYFEQISIADIAAEAGVSVGAFYRRFKNKEALLPVLYQSFQTILRDWIASNQASWRLMPSQQLTGEMVSGITHFFAAHKGLVRTLHLNARLHPDLINQAALSERHNDYNQLADFLVNSLSKGAPPEVVAAKKRLAQFAIFTMVTVSLEKAVYAELTPAIAAPHDRAESSKALTEMIVAYLDS